MSSFNAEKYVPTINPSLTLDSQSILRLSDLSTISAKRIRQVLAQEFPNDEIAENKSILDEKILDCFSKIRGDSSDEDIQRATSRPTQDLLKSDSLHPSPAPSASKRKVPSSSPMVVPTPPKKSRPASPTPRAKPPKPVKQSNYDSDEDAKLAAELDQALNSTPVRKTRGAAAGTRTKPRANKVKNKDDPDVPKKKRAPNPNSAFNAPLLLSPQLADVVFESELPRPVVVKKLWEYIKSNGLQNPSNKTEILCDDKLRALFNVDKVHMFTMNKFLSSHMWSKADVIGGDSSPKSSAKSRDTPITQSSPPKRSGKHVLSDAVVKSESEDESDESASEESRFSDSEEDR